MEVRLDGDYGALEEVVEDEPKNKVWVKIFELTCCITVIGGGGT